eukprot:CAMPEP_0172708020 /NCGR_PEP_ID=MMETSP1074-20121228/50316_1 /TAXON_ID=2916 /ORGANISM="Ceratium fusus, Strain PA161109" /LENGTH=118 /DNA_ID=CAMNT_0013530905 /DNA_START=73 /DNA_END=425 /DNA_ORIENTATION=-
MRSTSHRKPQSSSIRGNSCGGAAQGRSSWGSEASCKSLTSTSSKALAEAPRRNCSASRTIAKSCLVEQLRSDVVPDSGTMSQTMSVAGACAMRTLELWQSGHLTVISAWPACRILSSA